MNKYKREEWFSAPQNDNPMEDVYEYILSSVPENSFLASVFVNHFFSEKGKQGLKDYYEKHKERILREQEEKLQRPKAPYYIMSTELYKKLLGEK